MENSPAPKGFRERSLGQVALPLEFFEERRLVESQPDPVVRLEDDGRVLAKYAGGRRYAERDEERD